ncbi:MAG: MFS transporter [Anaerolineales bacterium]|nr:MFS transporter [Anaerolineales bacterium]
MALLLTMLGKYIFDPSLLAYIGDKVAYQARGRVMALMELGWSLSFLIGVPLVGLLIARFGWTAPFGVFAIFGALLLLGIVSKLAADQAPAKLPGERHSFFTILTSSLALNGLAIGLSISAANEVINLVFGVWLEDAFQLRIAALGATTAVIGISEFTGEFLVAGFVDKLGKPKTVMLGILLNILAAIGLTQAQGSTSAAVFGLLFFYITFELTLVSSIPLMSEILPEKRATMLSSTGASHSLGRAFGAFLAAPLYRIGIFANLAVAVGFNILALLALWTLTQRKSL